MPPYEKDPNFQGRAFFLERMAHKLEHPDRKHRVVLNGPRGIGYVNFLFSQKLQWPRGPSPDWPDQSSKANRLLADTVKLTLLSTTPTSLVKEFPMPRSSG
jgi:hypothetical protein